MKLILAIIITFFGSCIYAQKKNLTGNYRSGSDYLILTDSSLEFKYGTVYGFGQYKIKKNKVVLFTTSKTHDNSSYYIIDDTINSKSNFIISVFNPDRINPCTTFLTIKNSKNSRIYNNLMLANSNPFLVENINTNESQEKIALFYNGYDKLKIPLCEILGKSIKVYMTDNTTLFDETVTFNIVKKQGETIIVGPFHKLTRSEKRLYEMNLTWPWKKRFECHHELNPNEYRKQNWR